MLDRLATIGRAVLFVASAFAVAGLLTKYLARAPGGGVAAVKGAPRSLRTVTAVVADVGELTLPGKLVASRSVTIYSRATGYVRGRLADVGDRVQKGQVLAQLDTSYEQQLAQARAVLAQRMAALALAEASREYAHVSAARQGALAAANLIARHDAIAATAKAEVSDTNVALAKADLRAQDEAVRHLEDLVSMARVTAPMDGTVTERFMDVGDFVATGAAIAAQPLFAIDVIDPLHIFVRLPPECASRVLTGERANVIVREYPGRSFAAQVARLDRLEPTSRTRETEIVVANTSGDLLAGMEGEVTLAVTSTHPVVRVPSTTLLFDARGPHVATLGDQGSVQVVAVRVGCTFGDEVEILAGLVGGERVLLAPPGGLADGMRAEPGGDENLRGKE